MAFFKILLYFITCIILLIYIALRKRFSYWKELGILHDKPELIFGNFREFGRSKPLYLIVRELYMKYKGKAKYIGLYIYLRRSMLIFDLELLKNILIKDFEYFSTRGLYNNEKDDPISTHLISSDGDKWRRMRGKLNPIFSSGKMKFMFSTVLDVAIQLVEVINDTHKLESIDMGLDFKDICVRYAIDIIGSVAFGLDCNSLKDPKSEFKMMCEKTFFSRHHWVVVAFMASYPNLARKLGMKYHFDEIGEFFIRIVRDTVTYREKSGTQRNDFLNLLMELRSDESNPLTIEQIAAQAFAFFTAGFESTSSAISYCLYELALNQMVQNKVREEIVEVLARYEGKFTYEAMNEMKYMDKVINETMRLHSSVPYTVRETVKDYVIPNTNHVIKKGIGIVIPIDALHHDPELFPNPEQFDPERYSSAEMEKRSSMASIPFGNGPRICIGIRFARMAMMIGLVMILQNYRILPSKRTEIPLQYSLTKYFTISRNGVYLKTEKICEL